MPGACLSTLVRPSCTIRYTDRSTPAGRPSVDPSMIAPIPGVLDDDPEDLASRLIFRAHPDMVRAAWVRGRRLEALLSPGKVTA